MILLGLGLIALGISGVIYFFSHHSISHHISYLDIALLLGGGYLVVNGWLWARGVRTDFSFMQDINRFF
jgi:hypothetical protein